MTRKIPLSSRQSAMRIAITAKRDGTRKPTSAEKQAAQDDYDQGLSDSWYRRHGQNRSVASIRQMRERQRIYSQKIRDERKAK